MRSLVLSLCLVVIVGCSNNIVEYAGPQNPFAVVLRYEGSWDRALSVADPAGRLDADVGCFLELDHSGSVATCATSWYEPGDPGTLIFDLLSRDGQRTSHCETELRTGRSNILSVTLPDGRELRVSPPTPGALAGRCGYTVTTNNVY